MKKFIVMLVAGLIAGAVIAADDYGYASKEVSPTGTVLSCKTGSVGGANVVRVMNLGTNYVYANINSTIATVVTNKVAGYGFVPIAPLAYSPNNVFEWDCKSIVNVAMCTAAANLTSTVDIAVFAR